MRVLLKHNLLCLLMLVVALSGCKKSPSPSPTSQTADTAQAPLLIVVMDPLADRLACACVLGYAQRKYSKLAEFLENRLARPIQIVYGEDLAHILRLELGTIDLIIGKRSIVLSDAAEARMPVRPIAALTDTNGDTDLTGLFVVRHDDPAKTIADLKSYRILFGPNTEIEKNAAAIAALKASNVPLPENIMTSSTCNGAAVAVVEKDADAALIYSYAFALLEGCNTVKKGTLRVIGKTSRVPFIRVFATDAVTGKMQDAIMRALLSVKEDKNLLTQMESKTGFTKLPAPRPAQATSNTKGDFSGWTDWRGQNRDALSPHVPKALPTAPKFLWRQPLTGVAPAGIAATGKYVIVADKDKQKKFDIFRCFDADTGKQIWTVEYKADKDMDYTNSPRANPVIGNGLVYLLGAFGDLHCVKLDTGQIVWKKNIVKDFDAELITWGTCSAPLIVDDKLIVNPGAKNASLAALNLRTGEVLWTSPGQPAAYSSFIIGTFGDTRQIVGYDAISIGGWDPDSGKRLWTLSPEVEGDFNVPTPININGKLLAVSENNGARLYDFNSNGTIKPEPVAHNDDLAPDSSTPLVTNGLVFGASAGLLCLDAANGLKTLWSNNDDIFYDYLTLIAGNDRVLITTAKGELVLIRPDADGCVVQSRLTLFEKTEVWAHPALIPGRLYIRTHKEICCLLLDR